jgi:DNA-binding NarL/FixJ family response regulator
MTAAGTSGGSGGATIRVLLADDAELVRRGFALILSVQEDIEVVGEAADGSAAVAETARLKPDVVLMDIQMPGVDGLEATRRIVADHPSVRVVILTTFERDDYLFEALRAQASGFLLKNTTPEELVRAIKAAASGDALLAPSITRRVIQTFAAPGSVAALRKLPGSLTDREREILTLMAKGLSNAEIAQHFVLGESTVKTHVSHILAKLNARDRVQAVVLAYSSGLVRPGSTPP